MIIYNYLISGFLRTILLCSAVILCIIIVILSLLQSKQSDDAINVFSGQSTNLYTYQKKKGLDKTFCNNYFIKYENGRIDGEKIFKL